MTCPSDPVETAERYCLEKLTPEEAREYEEHYLACPRCAEEVEKAQAFIDALRRAAPKVQDD